MVDVFISYKREERARCERIHEKLKALDLDVWFDVRLMAACPCEQTLAPGPAVEICPVRRASVANQNECAKMTAQILGGLLDVQEDSARDDCRRFSRPFGQCSKRMGLLRS
jgi:hypothetical protein